MVVIVEMAAHAGVGCIIVIAIVACRALVSNGRMRAVQRIVLVMDIE